MEVKLVNLSKRWGTVVGADSINLEINEKSSTTSNPKTVTSAWSSRVMRFTPI